MIFSMFIQISHRCRRLFGQVRSVAWSPDDGGLVSCGMDGAVYEWNTQSGKRASECVLKTCSYTGVVFSSDCKTILAVGTDATLKEIQDCQVRPKQGFPQDLLTEPALSFSVGASTGLEGSVC